jgi:hypothetical protein
MSTVPFPEQLTAEQVRLLVQIAASLPYARTENGAAVRDVSDVRAWLMERCAAADPEMRHIPVNTYLWPYHY